MTKPRVLLVGRTRYRLPLNDSLERKFDALANELTIRVLGSAQPHSPLSSPTFRLVKAHGGRPSFKGYRGFPASLCASVK